MKYRALMFAALGAMLYRSAETDVGGTGGAPAVDPAAAELAKQQAAAQAQAKADAAAQAKAEKKAASEAAKAEKAKQKEAEKAAKAQAKVDAAAAAKAEKDAKAAAAVAEKQAREEAKKANQMPEQNGVRRPKPDTLCGKAWAVFDDLSQKAGAPVAIKAALEVTTPQGLVEGNVKAEYARWRKFFGVTGRVIDPSVAEAKAQKEAEKAAKAAAAKQKKAEEAAAKAQTQAGATA